MANEPWRDGLNTTERGYGARWQAARRQYLRDNPLCVMCAPRLVPATVVDHVRPHRGDPALFWDRGNWQALCAPCHNGPKQQMDNGRIARGSDANGMPTDPHHPWRIDRA